MVSECAGRYAVRWTGAGLSPVGVEGCEVSTGGVAGRCRWCSGGAGELVTVSRAAARAAGIDTSGRRARARCARWGAGAGMGAWAKGSGLSSAVWLA